MSSNIELASAEVMKQGRWKIIATMLAVTAESACLPILLLYWAALAGNLMWNQNAGLHSGQLAPLSCGSLVWLFSQRLAPRLRTAKAQRIINLVVGCVMWFIALQLARDGIAHAQALFS